MDEKTFYFKLWRKLQLKIGTSEKNTFKKYKWDWDNKYFNQWYTKTGHNIKTQ